VHHHLALIKLSQHDEGFILRYGNNELLLPFNEHISDAIVATIWDDTVEVFEVSKAHSAWFSDVLNMPCKLVFFPDDKPRPVDPDYALQHDHVSLADGYPILVIGQSSLDDLNSRMDVSIPMNRFRPNIVFEGGVAYEEDGWKQFEIGKSSFVGVKPCARCVLTTINQATGEKGVEPLATLNTYRRQGNKVLFGQNVLPITIGNTINTGDAIHVK
jgi:uncharacterized protein YcbX